MHRGGGNSCSSQQQRGPPPPANGGNNTPMLAVNLGGFNKPPPAPPSTSAAHPNQPRGRGHDSSLKDKLSTERSSIGGVPAAGNREKSPNPGNGATSPDFHDCSMCLSAYIQSLNTVCGSASRLSQCLAGLGNQGSGCPTSTQQCLREGCEGWEALTRAVGVASASVKTHMLNLLQEATKITSSAEEELGEAAKRQHLEKLLLSLSSSFMSLQCQFSGAVLETFTPYSSLMLTPPPSSLDSLSQYSTPITPPHFSAQLTPPPGGNFVLTSGAHQPTTTSLSKGRTRANSINHLNPHHPTNFGGSESSTTRRWSMGASGYSNMAQGGSNIVDKLDGGGNISGPGPPRRWSVPETNEPPPLSASGSLSGVATPWSMASMASGITPWTATPQMGDQPSSDGNRRLSVPVPPASSRESSAGGSRSNSHSRSATPDAAKSCLISNDELEEIAEIFNSGSLGSERASSHSRRSTSGGEDGERSVSVDRKSPGFCKHGHHKHGLAKSKGTDRPQTYSNSSSELNLPPEFKLVDDKGGGKGGKNLPRKSTSSIGFVKGNNKQQQHPRHRSPYQQQFASNKQQQQYQQLQLQQYLYQQQLQANAFLKLSPISSSILKQQQCYPLYSQHIYQQQQQLQQLKLNQSLQLLHLQQQQQQQRLQHHRKNSLQNLGSYYHELGSVYCETPPDDSSCSNSRSNSINSSNSCSNSRRGSANTTASSCSSAGTSGRTPVIHEATVENIESNLETLSPRWQDQVKSPIAERKSEICNAPTIPEVVTTSTPLWPPSGSVPGVTLTECTEEFRNPHTMEQPQSCTWPPQQIQEGSYHEEREDQQPVTGSWTAGHSLWSGGGFSLGGLMEDSAFGALVQPPPGHAKQAPVMRRHSTDTASYQQQLLPSEYHKYQPPPPLPLLSPGRNSRSTDNLHQLAPDMGDNMPRSSSCLDSNLESLLTLNALLPNSTPPSPTAHYSLFSS